MRLEEGGQGRPLLPQPGPLGRVLPGRDDLRRRSGAPPARIQTRKHTLPGQPFRGQGPLRGRDHLAGPLRG